MSNVIRFLETMGRDASQRHATADTLECALVAAHVDEAARSVIIGHPASLGSLLHAPTIVCCGLLPGREEEEEQDAPSRDDDEVRLHAASGCIA